MFYFCDVNKIIPHIEKLLAWNDYVVVPGLGGFVTQKQQAFLRDGILYAPSAVIAFNSLIDKEDGALAIEVSRSLSITYRKAVMLIEQEVNELQAMLRTGKTVSIGRLGYLQTNAQQCEFTPFHTPSFLPNNAFFNNIKLTHEAQKRETVKLHHSRWMQYAAVILLLISLFIPGTFEHNNLHQTADFSILKTFQLQEIVVLPESGNTKSNETLIEKHIQYQIVVAVFQSEIKALELCTILQADQYGDAQVSGSPGSYKVVVAIYHDLVQAVNHMEQIRKTDSRFTDAWVMKI